jgi:GAF domain-containing protein
VAGWVFVNREPAVVNNAYEDNRFYRKVDDMTRFHTRNIVCTPLLDYKDDDLELLNLAARMVAVAINNSRRYKEISVTNEARRKFIKKISGDIGNIFD